MLVSQQESNPSSLSKKMQSIMLYLAAAEILIIYVQLNPLYFSPICNPYDLSRVWNVWFVEFAIHFIRFLRISLHSTSHKEFHENQLHRILSFIFISIISQTGHKNKVDLSSNETVLLCFFICYCDLPISLCLKRMMSCAKLSNLSSQ